MTEMIPSAAPSTDHDEDTVSLRVRFISAMRLVPGPVAIVACAAGDAWTGLVATAWTSLSADPPTMIACVNKTASAHDVIQRGRAFSINLLAPGDLPLVSIFSGQTGLKGQDRFDVHAWRKGALGQPLLRSAVAAFECVLEESHCGRSHVILIGAVRAVESRPDADPLVYRDGRLAVTVPVADRRAS